MSRPFIVWTMQRTGGTALAQTLMGLSEHPAAEHEPFNWAQDKPREFWPNVETWRPCARSSGKAPMPMR